MNRAEPSRHEESLKITRTIPLKILITLLNLINLIFMTETISRTDEVQPRPKYIFNIVELTSTFLLYRGFVHHHHRNINEQKELLQELFMLRTNILHS